MEKDVLVLQRLLNVTRQLRLKGKKCHGGAFNSLRQGTAAAASSARHSSSSVTCYLGGKCFVKHGSSAECLFAAVDG